MIYVIVELLARRKFRGDHLEGSRLAILKCWNDDGVPSNTAQRITENEIINSGSYEVLVRLDLLYIASE